MSVWDIELAVTEAHGKNRPDGNRGKTPGSAANQAGRIFALT